MSVSLKMHFEVVATEMARKYKMLSIRLRIIQFEVRSGLPGIQINRIPFLEMRCEDRLCTIRVLDDP